MFVTAWSSESDDLVLGRFLQWTGTLGTLSLKFIFTYKPDDVMRDRFLKRTAETWDTVSLIHGYLQTR